MITQLLIFMLAVSTIWIIIQFVVPFINRQTQNWQEKHVQKSADRLEQMFISVNVKKLTLYYTLSPIVSGVIGLIIFKNFLGFFVFAVGGLVFPAMRIKQLQEARCRKFNAQLPDGIMILSSCLKGGLSLLQAIETMVDEMPSPISQEFAMIIKENKMGVALEESLSRLTKRMPSEDLNLMNTAILVARETGGNLPEVFSRLVGTIRSKVNVNETVRTMTVMGRAQGFLLAILPFVFVIFIYKTNPTMMEDMIKTEQGRIMLGIAAVLQIIGIVLIKIFSRVEV